MSSDQGALPFSTPVVSPAPDPPDPEPEPGDPPAAPPPAIGGEGSPPSGLFFHYFSPTTPGNPSWDEDLGAEAVRLGSVGGIITEAQLGAVGISSIQIDDPDADVGHAGDAIVGLKQFYMDELRAPVGRQRVWTGYIGDRRYRRGDDQRRSLILADSRVVDVTLVDINSFLSFRLFTTEEQDATSSFDRPVESDVDRIAALLAVDFLSTTLFDGLVSATDPVQMDANDYAGQRPIDVLNDCAQQSGKNFFVFYDEAGTYTTAGSYALFYDFNDAAVYPAICSFSNDPDEIDTTSVFGPMMDMELTKDPSRITSGVFLDYDGGSVYRTEDDVGLTTSYTFGWRDQRFSSSNIKTATRANIRADRYLRENATEDETVRFSVFMPAANVNDWREGQYGTITGLHLPGFEAPASVRCVRRTVAQVEDTGDWYTVRYEMTTSTGAEPAGDPSGAFDRQRPGISFSGIPELPTATTPGNVLLAVVIAAGATSQFPADVRFIDNPSTSGTAEIPPFPDHDGWTVLGTVACDYSSMNIVGPSPSSGILLAVAWREVAVGEVTTTPVQVSGDNSANSTSIHLWELPTTTPPVLVETFSETNGTNPDQWQFGTDPANLVGVFAFMQADYGAGPDAVTADSGVTTVQSGDSFNNPTPSGSAWSPYIWIGQREAGGVVGVTYDAIAAYTSINGCGLLIELPAGITLPPIGYPGNQSS